MKNISNTFLIFIVSPFIALYSVLVDYRKNDISFFFPIFLAFIGASLYPVGDAERYRDRFYELHDRDLSLEQFSSTVLDGELSLDLAVPSISYIISKMTRNEKILFAVFGLILGFFYGRNIQFILDKFNKTNLNFFVLILIFVFSLIVSFWDGIRGVRMWTGAHIFFYAVSHIMERRNLKSFGFLFLACAYHFSFLLPVFIFLGYYFLPKKQFLPIAFIFFIISLIVSDFNIEFIKNLVLKNSPKFFLYTMEGYTGDDYIDTLKEDVKTYSFHFAISGIVLKFTLVYLLIISYIGSRNLLNIKNVYTKYFLFVFILFGVGNFLSVLPSGGRFVRLALLFSIVPIYFGYQNISRIRRYVYHVSILPLLFWLVISIRESFYSLSIASVFGNPILILLDYGTSKNLDSLIK
ncbi:MAG: hypothetical protein EBX50_07335 [Chitinophagia bacterium]|nr:hypothetical protein [Chitinophagia bacterium]